ncbi:hypothetical protein EGW08_008630, partial [Elysia chlorotica]
MRWRLLSSSEACKARPTLYANYGFALILLVVSIAHMSDHAEGTYAPYIRRICRRYPIHTTVEKQSGDHGFRIKLDGLTTSDTYRPGETYTVHVTGADQYQRLMGVMVEATAIDSKGETYSPGSFNTSIDMRVQDLRLERTCAKPVVAHRYLIRKDAIKFLWTAPRAGAGCVHFNATVIEHSDKWYKDEGMLHKVICEESTQRDSASAVPSDQSAQQAPSQNECCACGKAVYDVVFQGSWSRNTHPKGFPDEKDEFLLHWSNLVGASHSSDYRIWEYGQFSSRGVKEVCEYGSARTILNELKANQFERVHTVVKTDQLWGPTRIMEPLTAGFTVTKKKPLISLLTMIGPSPDWCLGISAESMCTTNCTWKDSMEIDLYPWDAGTDSRVTYLGDKMATVPAERIHRLTNTNPNDRDSPFYGLDIKPFARLTLTKKNEYCTDDEGKSTSAEKAPSTDELMEKCETSPWSDWSECSNACGSGLRERRRMLKTPGVTQDMCELDLVQTDSCMGDCKGRGKKLSDSFVMRHDDQRDPTDTCAVTDWSVWSPCSATCGLGMKERWRMFLFNPEQRVDCGIHLMEKDLCRGEIYDCQKAIMMKNFTAICQQPLDVGPCRGDFPRWFYNHTMEKCQTFSYGGCRGNENRFDTESELRINCMVTPWSEWSECSATCGRGTVMKTRMIKVEPKNGGQRCPRRLVKKKKCRQKRCRKF